MTIIAIVLVLLVGAGGFFAGMKYQQNKVTTAAAQLGARGGRFAQGAAGTAARNGANRPVVGTILSVDSNSITVKMADGSTKIVLLGSSALISKTATASQSDLTTGTNVAVEGATNADGSVTASSIQVNPMFGGGFGRAAGASSTPAASAK